MFLKMKYLSTGEEDNVKHVLPQAAISQIEAYILLRTHHLQQWAFNRFI